MKKNKLYFKRCINLLLLVIVILLPFAEWKFIGLPLRGRPIVIDFNSYLSVSVFDLVFVLFAVACLPLIWQICKRSILLNWHLIWWLICVILIIVLFVQQKPELPYLNLTSINVIDVRSLIIHFAMAVCVTVAVIQFPLASIARGGLIFYIINSCGAVILCYFALTANTFFQYNYPFATPSSISFPFMSQNVAAAFMVLCCVGSVGATLTRKMYVPLLVCFPIFLLAAALTGSRSSMFICCITILFYIIIYIVYYRKATDGCLANYKPAHPAALMIALCIGVILILINIDWHPIRRSLSIFDDVRVSPLILITGGKDAPRSQLWNKALQAKKLEEKSKAGNVSHENLILPGNESHKPPAFSLGLTSVENGCKTISTSTSELKIGKPYYVRLTLSPKGPDAHQALLTVFEDSKRQQLVGSTKMTFNLPQLSNIYYFIADTDSKYVLVEAELYAFTKILGNEADANPLKNKTIRVFEEPFNGGAEPIILLENNSIRIKARTKRLRGYISEASMGYDNKNEFTLEYTMNLKSVISHMILHPPVMFYVGLGESANLSKEGSWRLIRNGIFIRHERYLSNHFLDVKSAMQKDKFERWINSKNNERHSRDDLLKLFNNEVRCGKGGYNFIGSLWEPLILEANKVPKNRRARYLIKPENGNIKSVLSVIPGPEWNADDSLAEKGSTHNVYLDWYYYVGTIPFGIFLMLIISLLVAFAHFTWNSRFSKEFPFILSILCQLLIITALMYAHPYIWLKYIWFVFGLATAVMIHPDLNKHNRKLA